MKLITTLGDERLKHLTDTFMDVPIKCAYDSLRAALLAKEVAEKDLKLCAQYLRKRGIDISDLRRSYDAE